MMIKPKTRTLKHPLGLDICTPLLIPSFSSKGFKFSNSYTKSEVESYIHSSKEYLFECFLVSAYDLHYNYTPDVKDLKFTEFLFIDSGGYETSDVEDFSGITKYPFSVKEWSCELLNKTISKIPTNHPSIIVNFDRGDLKHSLSAQIENAKLFFDKHKNKMSDFLIKPERGGFLDVKTILSQIRNLHCFQVIGFTEKELGDSILDRMIAIAQIRIELDKVRNNAPIHVFGSLDPVSTILYFLAGAEIFDGLTWLKYAYWKGKAVYIENYGLHNNELGIKTKHMSIKNKVIASNINYLEKMKIVMIDYCITNNFSEFNRLGGEGFGEMIKNANNEFTKHLNN